MPQENFLCLFYYISGKMKSPFANLFDFIPE